MEAACHDPSRPQKPQEFFNICASIQGTSALSLHTIGHPILSLVVVLFLRSTLVYTYVQCKKEYCTNILRILLINNQLFIIKNNNINLCILLRAIKGANYILELYYILTLDSTTL